MKKCNRILIVFVMILNILIQPFAQIITVFAEEELSSNIIEEIETIEISQLENSDELTEVIKDEKTFEELEPEDDTSTIEDSIEIVDEIITSQPEEKDIEDEEKMEDDSEKIESSAITSIQYIADYSPNTNLNIGSTSFYKFKLTNLEAVIQNATIKLYIPKSNIDTYNDVASYFPDQGFRERTKVYTENEFLVVELSVGNLSNSYYQEFVFSFQTIDDGSMTNDTYIPVRAEVISQNEILAETGITSFHYQSRKPIFKTKIVSPDEDSLILNYQLALNNDGTGNGSGNSP
ncbi:MAG: hypothetical protein GX963_14470, partial [Bacteroidales bacterium]|nr:hypothetical protein [Bacteroidales bacterium]